MNIYIDESGSFVSAPSPGSWNTVAAFALPEPARKGLEKAIAELKRQSRIGSQEVKLNDLDEPAYLAFVAKLTQLNGSLFCVATDAGLNTPESVAKHQRAQASKVLENLDKMQYEGGRQGVALIASQIEKLSPQLYVQLICQLELMYDVVSRAINYYAQHNPKSLREFRWRFDQKDIDKTTFEDVFEKLSPAILQTMSISQPFMRVKEFDYSSMKQYEYEPGEAPTYLKDVYGINTSANGSMFNIQKLIRGNIDFVDSKDSDGIQAVDLIVSGIRKCLRKGFQDNERVASLLGALMLQAIRGQQSLNLVGFGVETRPDQEISRLVALMTRNAKAMLKDD
jgi:hypothetical protein